MTPETRATLTAAYAWLAVDASRWCQGTYAMASAPSQVPGDDAQYTGNCDSWTELAEAHAAGEALACCATGAIVVVCVTPGGAIQAKRAYAAIDELAVALATRGLVTIHTPSRHLLEVTEWNDRHDTQIGRAHV